MSGSMLFLDQREAKEKVNKRGGLCFVRKLKRDQTEWSTNACVLVGCLEELTTWLDNHAEDSIGGLFELRWIVHRGILRFGLGDGTNIPHSGLIIDGDLEGSDSCSLIVSDVMFSGKYRVSQELSQVQSAGTIVYSPREKKVKKISLDSGHYKPADIKTMEQARGNIHLSRFAKSWSAQHNGNVNALLGATLHSVEKDVAGDYQFSSGVDKGLIEEFMALSDPEFQPAKAQEAAALTPPCGDSYKGLYATYNPLPSQRFSCWASSRDHSRKRSSPDSRRGSCSPRSPLASRFGNNIFSLDKAPARKRVFTSARLIKFD